MRKFSINMFGLDTWYNHYLSARFINARSARDSFKGDYPLEYSSRKFDKAAIKYKHGDCFWCLDNKWHRVGNPAFIYSDGHVSYYENGEWIR